MGYPPFLKSFSFPGSKSALFSVHRDVAERRATIGSVSEINREPTDDCAQASIMTKSISVSSFVSKKLRLLNKKDSYEKCFEKFQECILSNATTLSQVSYKTLSKHPHSGSIVDSTRNTFIYRGVTSNTKADNSYPPSGVLQFGDKKYLENEQTKLRNAALTILKVPFSHITELDAVLEGIRKANTVVTDTQPPQLSMLEATRLAECIDAKIKLKKLLAVSLECIDCELENLSVVQFDLLQQLIPPIITDTIPVTGVELLKRRLESRNSPT
jgi:hypothetical protein